MKCKACDKSTDNPKFCSLSCAATFNNAISPKRSKNKKICKMCGGKVSGRGAYCSKICQSNFNFTEKSKNGYYYSPDHSGNTRFLRKFIIRKHGNNCMICGQSGNDWNGKPITLTVDHINGHANDWSVPNIRIICPNCDSQLPTYKGRNKGNSTRKYTITQK
ncbi:MAG: hypothetical protein M0R80_00645 [Proteobacteria bacterium]|nr:hypothetical protein [Pseudomonadota bacterium]